MTDRIDTSAEEVERLAMRLPESQPYSPNSHNAAEMLRTIAAERDALQAVADANEHVAEYLSRENAVLKAEVERLREELSQHDGDAPTMHERVGKKAAGRLMDGKEWNEVPT